VLIWRPVPAVDDDDERALPDGFVGAATVTTYLPAPP
jgi:hypothetical protein